MRYIHILIMVCICAIVSSCEKDRFPEVENSANAQFKRALGTAATPASFNTGTLSKATPAATDNFNFGVVENGNVASVKVMVDYRKAATPTVTTFTQQYADITSWPVDYSVSLNSLTTLFAANGLTSANVVANDRFVFRAVFTLKSGTVVSEQAAVLLALPYATTLTYTVTN